MLSGTFVDMLRSILDLKRGWTLLVILLGQKEAFLISNVTSLGSTTIESEVTIGFLFNQVHQKQGLNLPQKLMESSF